MFTAFLSPMRRFAPTSPFASRLYVTTPQNRPYRSIGKDDEFTRSRTERTRTMECDTQKIYSFTTSTLSSSNIKDLNLLTLKLPEVVNMTIFVLYTFTTS